MELQEFRDNLLEDALVQHQSTSAPSSATEAPSEDLLKKDQPTVTPPSSVLVPVKPPGNTPANVHKVKPTVITKTTDQKEAANSRRFSSDRHPKEEPKEESGLV